MPKPKTILPRGKYILILPDPAEEKENEYGLIIPSNIEHEQKAYGVVQSTGEQIKDVKKGDYCVYGAYAGETIKIKEKNKEVEYKLLHDDDVIAFLK